MLASVTNMLRLKERDISNVTDPIKEYYPCQTKNRCIKIQVFRF